MASIPANYRRINIRNSVAKVVFLVPGVAGQFERWTACESRARSRDKSGWLIRLVPTRRNVVMIFSFCTLCTALQRRRKERKEEGNQLVRRFSFHRDLRRSLLYLLKVLYPDRVPRPLLLLVKTLERLKRYCKETEVKYR